VISTKKSKKLIMYYNIVVCGIFNSFSIYTAMLIKMMNELVS
jgi:hypothetical protein